MFTPQVKAQVAYLTDFVRLTKNPAERPRSPSWSPDGSKITYFAQSYGVSWWRHIWTMNNDGSGKTQLTFGNVVDEGPDYSQPDGEKIVFFRYRGSGKHDIYLMNEDGTDIERYKWSDYAYIVPRWSNDGERLAYYYGGAGSSVNEIRIMNIDDKSEVTVVSSDYSINSVYWSPDDTNMP